MQIQNDTPFETMILPGYDREGRETMTVIAKGTFSLDSRGEPVSSDAGDQLPIVMADEYWGEPGESPVKYESDLAPYKPATDLILIGHAYDPKGRTTRSQRVEFSVGSQRQSATVSSSESLDRIPLHFAENMRGGPRLLRAKRPKGGFGFYPKQCKPRLGHAGTYDEKWLAERSPFLPDDFDYRFFQAAFPELVCDAPLQGGERIFLRGATPDGVIESSVPQVDLELDAYFVDREEKAELRLDTLVAVPDEGRMALTWRSMVMVNGPPSSVRGFWLRPRGFVPEPT